MENRRAPLPADNDFVTPAKLLVRHVVASQGSSLDQIGNAVADVEITAERVGESGHGGNKLERCVRVGERGAVAHIERNWCELVRIELPNQIPFENAGAVGGE